MRHARSHRLGYRDVTVFCAESYLIKRGMMRTDAQDPFERKTVPCFGKCA